jgi:hypothetical protein
MPWMPEVFTAPIAEALRAQEPARANDAIAYYEGIMAEEPGALIRSFAREPRVNDPRVGYVEGDREFRAFAMGTAEWLREQDAVVENVALTRTPTRTVEEVVLHLLADNGGRVELPVAVVSDRNPDRTLKTIRIYHSMWPLTGEHRVRPPLLPADPELHAEGTPGDYQWALAEGDLEGIVARLLVCVRYLGAAGDVRTSAERVIAAVPPAIASRRRSQACAQSSSQAWNPKQISRSTKMGGLYQLTKSLEEPPPPAFVVRVPAELTLELLVGGAPEPEHPPDERVAGEHACEELGNPRQPLRPERLGKDRHPLGGGRRFVVDYVVDARPRPLEGCHGRGRGVVYVDKGVRTFAAAYHRVAPLPDLPADVPALCVPGSRPVEEPVAQDDALEPFSREHRVFNLLHRLDGRPYGHRSVQVERRLFRLHRTARRRVPVGGTLYEEATNPGAAGGTQQVPRSLAAHAVVGRVVLPKLARVQALRKVGELVDHGIRLGPRNDRPQPSGVEDVAQNRLGAEFVELSELLLRPGHRDHLVTRLDQLGHQPPADGAASARKENLHRLLTSRKHRRRFRHGAASENPCNPIPKAWLFRVR